MNETNQVDSGGAPQLIQVGGNDEAITKLQLAARWAERSAPASGDTLVELLRRFRNAYDFVQAVSHGVEPELAEA